MHNKRNLSTALICALLVIALAVVPMLTLTVFAEGEDEVKLYGPAGKLYTLVDGKLPEVAEIPEGYTGYTFRGWTTDGQIAEETTETPTIYEAGTAVTSGTYYTVFTKTETIEAGTEYTKTEIADIKPNDEVVITIQNSTGVYALPHNNGSTSSPIPFAVTVSGNNLTATSYDNILWKLGGNSTDGYIFYKASNTAVWLYTTSSSNTGIRVGTNSNKTFEIVSGYLKNKETGRYFGIYDNKDFRSYTSIHSNIANQTLAFYVKPAGGSTTTYYSGDICVHDNYETVDSEKDENNMITVTCGNCKAVLDTRAYCAHTNTTTELVTETAMHDGYKIVTCVDCGEEISNEILSATCDHSYNTVALAGGGSAKICANCGHTTDRVPGSITITPDVSNLRFYIATKRTSGNYFYMTNDLGTGSTKRYQAEDSGLTSLPSNITSADDNKIFALEKNDDGTYKIYATGITSGAKYLGYTSGNSGTLVAADSALKLTIDKNTDGTYNIHFTASDTERYIALNGTSGNNYFAFYKSGQKQDLSLIPVGDSEIPDLSVVKIDYPSFTGTQAQLGEDLAAKFGVDIPDGIDTSKLSLKITSGHGNVSTIDTIITEGDVKYFLYDGIAPQCIGDSIKAELIYDGESVDVYGYNFTEYLREAWLKNSDDADLSQLIADLLAYGKAAQEYTGHEVTITDEDIASYSEANRYAPTEDDNVRAISGDKESAVKFKGVGVRFDVVNSIYVVITGATENTTVKVGNKTYTANAEDEVRIYLDAISVLDFGTAVTIELCEGDAVVQTLTYSINSYCYSMINGNKSDEMKALALALYNYGISAANYANQGGADGE